MDMETYNISESELEVMKVLWSQSPLTSREIIENLDHSVWSENTIKTFINRLLKKGVITHKKMGRSYLYSPNIKYDDFIETENKLFLDKVYNGAVDVFLYKILKQVELSTENIEGIQKILNEKKLNKSVLL